MAFVRTAEQPELVPQQGSLAAQEPAEGPPDPTADHLPEARAGSPGVHPPAAMGGQVLALARLPKRGPTRVCRRAAARSEQQAAAVS